MVLQIAIPKNMRLCGSSAAATTKNDSDTVKNSTCESLEKLRKMTNNLPNLLALTTLQGITSSHAVEHRVEGGTSLGFGLWWQPELAIQRIFMSAGARYPKHQHAESEWILVVSGRLLLHVDNGDKELAPQGMRYFLPHEAHGATALEDCWQLCITMPASDGYPNVS